jgi:hypothetical protein
MRTRSVWLLKVSGRQRDVLPTSPARELRRRIAAVIVRRMASLVGCAHALPRVKSFPDIRNPPQNIFFIFANYNGDVRSWTWNPLTPLPLIWGHGSTPIISCQSFHVPTALHLLLVSLHVGCHTPMHVKGHSRNYLVSDLTLCEMTHSPPVAHVWGHSTPAGSVSSYPRVGGPTCPFGDSVLNSGQCCTFTTPCQT